jgi:hypothetical protein
MIFFDDWNGTRDLIDLNLLIFNDTYFISYRQQIFFKYNKLLQFYFFS